MGYQVVTYEPPKPEEAKQIIYLAVESGLPALPIVAHKRDGDSVRHALEVVGHTIGTACIYGTETQFLASSNWVPDFLANDDQRGSYKLFTLSDSEMPDLTKVSIRTAPDLPPGLEADLWNVVVPYPKQVLLTGEQAVVKSQELLKTAWRTCLGGDPPRGLCLRTFLVESDEFKIDLPKREVPPSLRLLQLLRGKPMPRYIWVTEVSNFADRELRSPREIRVSGTIIVDAASQADTLDFVALHLHGFLMHMKPDEKVADNAFNERIQLPDERVYSPFWRRGGHESP